MFNAERLLGSLITNALGQGLTGRVSKSRRHGGGLKSMAGSLISQNKTAIGMGLLGLAVGAYEHFTQNQNPQSSGSPPSPGGSSPVAPMPQTGGGAPRPAVNWTPPPLPSDPKSDAPRNEEALLLIRAMIAAANADHAVDDVERQTILEKITASGLGAEERRLHRTGTDKAPRPALARRPGEVSRTGRAGIRGFGAGTGSGLRCREELLAPAGIRSKPGCCYGGKVAHMTRCTSFRPSEARAGIQSSVDCPLLYQESPFSRLSISSTHECKHHRV